MLAICRLILPLAALVLVAIPAEGEADLGEVAFQQALKDVGTDLRLMCVAAHPDDEDGATLAMYRKKWGYKTFAVIATRGEGGQNEIGPELYEELGVLRTHEMRRASEITGAELHFLDLPEFGYSKSAEETFAIWGEDEALRRMVRTIRELKPDVIISHHTPGGGHGHHQVVGQALLDAFEAAADPDQFPEQIGEGLEAWQVARFYVRPYGGGSGGIAEPVENKTSELDPLRGYSYAEIAGQALQEHESQGMGFFVDRFLSTRSTTTYHLQKQADGGTTDGGDVPAPGGGLFAGLMDRVPPEARELSASKAGRSEAFEAALALLDKAEGEHARARLNRLAQVAAELKLRANISDDEAVPGQTVEIATSLFDYGAPNADSVTLAVETKPWLDAKVSDAQTSDLPDKEASASFKVTIANDQAPTIPHPEHLFKPHFLEPQLTVVATVKTGNGDVVVRHPIYVDVAPAVSVAFHDAPYLVQSGDKSAEISLLLTNHAPEARDATVHLVPPRGFLLDQDKLSVSFKREGDQTILPLETKIIGELLPGDYPLTAAVAESNASANTIARVVDLEIPQDIRVGVVESYDDTFMTTLAKFGVPHEALTIEDFTADKLDTFTTIIVDIRAYLVRPDLTANNQALLDYVKRGGTVIVNYHKTFEWEESYAPYPISLSRNRVTVEDAPIKLLVPDHPLFNTPNKIADVDWEGWIQERGLYFPAKWDDAYTPLIETVDPGENPPPGSVLIAEYGDGTYLYTALGWYRQLRELHPGTLRIFANMLAL